MARFPVNMRVGAILCATETEIKFLGYGTYVGDEVPPNAGFRLPNPKIVLDNGKVIWGYQCWWGAEDEMKAKLARRPKTQALIEVDIDQENGNGENKSRHFPNI